MNKRKATRYERALAAVILESLPGKVANALTGGESFKEAMRGVVHSVGRAVLEMAVWQAAASELCKRFGTPRRRRRGKTLRGQRARRPR